jgi:thymidine phosphorylase
VEAPVVRAVHPASSGIVAAIATRDIGLAVVALGGGRTRPGDAIDHAVGFAGLAALGDRVDTERPIGVVHARTEAEADAAAQTLRQAYTVAEIAPAETPLILERIGDAA